MVNLIYVFFISFKLWALPLEQIFQESDARSLKFSVEKYRNRNFLEILCEKQKEKRKPPTACYELSLNVDAWCLRLKLRDLKLPELQRALESKFLSVSCRKHLEKQKKILIYRQKDFLIPEIKKHWTESKTFF